MHTLTDNFLHKELVEFRDLAQTELGLKVLRYGSDDQLRVTYEPEQVADRLIMDLVLGTKALAVAASHPSSNFASFMARERTGSYRYVQGIDGLRG